MVIEIDKSDIFWTYISRFLKIGQGLILLPLILKLLSENQIAIWAVFTTITSLVAIFDLGFSNVFSRNATQLFSTPELNNSYFLDNDIVKENKERYDLKKLLVIMKKYYSYASLVILIFLSTLGTLYINYISGNIDDKFQLYLSWFFLVGSIVLNFYYNYLAIVLQSKGLIKETQKISFFGILLSLVFAVIGIFLDWGLMAITLAGFLSVVFNRLFLTKIFNREIEPILPTTNFNFETAYFKDILKDTYKSSIASFSSIIIYRSGIIISTLFLPLAESGSFALSMNLAFILSEISFMFFFSHLPKINSLVYLNDKVGLKKIYLSSIFVSVLSFLLGGIFLTFYGNNVLLYIESNLLLIPKFSYAFVFMILFLDQIMNMSTFILFSSNDLSYTKSYFLSAIMIVISIIIYCTFNMSLFSILFPQLIIQLSYNYWFWPLNIMKKLELKFVDITSIFLK